MLETIDGFGGPAGGQVLQECIATEQAASTGAGTAGCEVQIRRGDTDETEEYEKLKATSFIYIYTCIFIRNGVTTLGCRIVRMPRAALVPIDTGKRRRGKNV